MNRIREFWLRLQASLWFVPAVIVLGCMSLALALIEVHSWIDVDLGKRWPRLFGVGSQGARSMLSAIATSMVTVAGVIFSVTIVALSQASSQYSPRVLRNFMDDRPTQAVLGVFVGIFAYCLVVLRTLRNGDEGGGFLPSLAVLGGMVLALLGVAMLIYFIHHVALAIQASSILARIASDTTAAIEHLFPEPVGRPAHQVEYEDSGQPELWCPVPATKTGYLIAVDHEALLEFAARHDRVVRIAQTIGEFVIKGRPLACVSGQDPLGEEDMRALCKLFTVQRQRTVYQDAPYGVQQMVDVALKALSPGINDPTTAVMCIDHLSALLVQLAGRHTPGPYRRDAQALRVVAPGPDFDSMLALAFEAIIDHARGDVDVFRRLLGALATISEATDAPRRRLALQRQLDRAIEGIEHTVQLPSRREELLREARALTLRLGGLKR